MKKKLKAFWKDLYESFFIILFCVFIILAMVWVNGECNQKYYAAEKTEVTEEWTELGTFKISHYCNCHSCVGNNTTTYTGTIPQRYRTIAVDPKVIPLGSIVYIDTYGYRIAEDTGSAVKGKHIDVFTTSHQHALELGIQKQKVWLVERKTK